MRKTDTNFLSIQILLGASDIAKIKMELYPSVDQTSKPSAEQTKIGWAVILPGRESNIVSDLFTKTSGNNYENSCDASVLELKEIHYKHDAMYMKSLTHSLKGTKKVGTKHS